MAEHKVLTLKDKHYPFRPYWGCACGHKFNATVMGHDLYKEFAEHEKKERDEQSDRDRDQRKHVPGGLGDGSRLAGKAQAGDLAKRGESAIGDDHTEVRQVHSGRAHAAD